MFMYYKWVNGVRFGSLDGETWVLISGNDGDKVVLPEPVTLPQEKTTMTEEEFIAEWKDIPKRFDFEICNFTKWSVLVDEAKLKLALSYGVKE